MKIAVITALFIIFTVTLSFRVVAAEEHKACAATHEKAVAIFIEPTEKELERMREENSEEDFYTIADDVMYHSAGASKFLEKRKIPVCFTTNEEHKFISKDNEEYSMGKECRHWCLILWNGVGEPVDASIVDIYLYDTYLKGAGGN